MWTAFKALSIGSKLFILAAILALFGATWYVGYSKGANISEVKIAQYEGKINKLNADLKTAQGKTDVKVVTKYLDREKVITNTVYKTRTIVEQSVPEQFTLSKGWVYAYNQSVLGLDVDAELAADPTPSTVSEMRALADTIIPNNGKALTTAERLKALQEWVAETEKNFEKVNSAQ